ncbi:MAG: FGGY-family carbohydrate kinase [Candidatus Bathyarchaeota archaeon]|nr:FGGY-family carbohydrate kinase [Candidatus Bathyarchaeota archaeon]
MILGVDIGASTVKQILLDGSEIIFKGFCELSGETFDLKSLQNIISEAERRYEIKLVALSGGGSRMINESPLGKTVIKVDEISAIGIGGLRLTGKDKGLVVSAGTGTAMVAVYENGRIIKHVGGTGVGGGTLLGLSRKLIGVGDFSLLERIASQGRAGKVDLTVCDIAGGPVGIIPADATASNFGKVSADSSKEDIAAGIFNMVSQVIGVLAAMAAKAYGLENDVILTGGLARSKLITQNVTTTANLFGVKVNVPKDPEYCAAVGAAHYALTKKLDEKDENIMRTKIGSDDRCFSVKF